MLDVYHKVSDMLVKDTPFLLEQVVPVRMVSNNLYSISFQAEHISSPKSNARRQARLEAGAQRTLYAVAW
jgi:hypothetical protein